MSRQALVGIVTILGLLGIFVIFYVLSDFGTKRNGYRMGVHFNSAAGLHKGALVYESGVNVGSIDTITLLPDFTVDVILALRNDVDIPKNSKFFIQAPLTGDPSLLIIPPVPPVVKTNSLLATPVPVAVAILPHEVQPINEQAVGTNPASIAELLVEGQGEVKRLDVLLADLQKREPKLLDTFQSALTNANEITIQSNREIQKLSQKVNVLADSLQTTLSASGNNVNDLTKQLDTIARTDSVKVDALLNQLAMTSKSLNETVDSVRDLAKNPQVRGNLIETTQSIADTTKTIASLVGDLRNVTGSPQTQAQLRDTVANLDAVTQKTNSLLAGFGGKSSVYGVDRGATPAPGPTGAAPGRRPQGSPQSGASAPPAGTSESGNVPENFKSKIGAIARNLVSLQVRIAGLNAQPARSNSSPLLTKDRGPQTDVNLIAFPRGTTSALIGANDIGSGNTSYNFAGMGSFGKDVKIGGGVLYSRLGILGSLTAGKFTAEGRIYDPRHPTLDAYGRIKAADQLELFLGERDLSHTGRRSVFGVQLQF
jgi:ABC-type transporter Mla subunit MlaD